MHAQDYCACTEMTAGFFCKRTVLAHAQDACSEERGGRFLEDVAAVLSGVHVPAFVHDGEERLLADGFDW